MSDEPENLVLRYLRSLSAEMRLVREDLSDIKSRLLNVENQLGSLAASEQGHYATMMSAFDRMKHRLERAERRTGLLDLPDLPTAS